MVGNWFHRLLNPHCDKCIEKPDVLVETLLRLLDAERAVNYRLINRLLPDAEVKQETQQVLRPIGKSTKSWSQTRAELERADRENAASRYEAEAAVKKQNIISTPSQSTEDLERELEVSNANF